MYKLLVMTAKHENDYFYSGNKKHLPCWLDVLLVHSIVWRMIGLLMLKLLAVQDLDSNTTGAAGSAE